MAGNRTRVHGCLALSSLVNDFNSMENNDSKLTAKQRYGASIWQAKTRLGRKLWPHFTPPSEVLIGVMVAFLILFCTVGVWLYGWIMLAVALLKLLR